MVPRIRQTRNYERFEWRDRRGKEGEAGWEGLGGMEVGGRSRLSTVPPQTITLSPRGASGGFGSQTWPEGPGGLNSRHLLSVLQFAVHIICLSVFYQWVGPSVLSCLCIKTWDELRLQRTGDLWTPRGHNSIKATDFCTASWCTIPQLHLIVLSKHSSLFFPWFLEAFAQLCYEILQIAGWKWLM